MGFSAVASAVGSVASGLIGSDSAEDAAEASRAGTQAAVTEQRAAREDQKEALAQGRRDLAPYRRAGGSAVNLLEGVLLGKPQPTAESRRLSGRSSDFQNRAKDLDRRIESLRKENERLQSTTTTSQAYAPRIGPNVLGVLNRGGGVVNNKQIRQNENKIQQLIKKRDRLQGRAQKFSRRARGARKPVDAGEVFRKTSPGYQFRKEEGEKALQNSQLARNGILSGRALKEALRYNQNFASNEFGNFINRLFALTDIGRSAAATTANTTPPGATNTARLLANQGQTDANAILQGGNAIRGGISSGINNAIALMQQDKLLDALSA